MSKLLFRPALLLILFSCFFLTAHSASALNSAAIISEQQLELLQKIQKKYRDLTSLRFNFSQTVQSNGRRRFGEGNSIFYRSVPGRPGIMRWNYTKPDPQIILNDGKNLSIYTQIDKQLLVTPSGDLQTDITYSFFAGSHTLLDDFTIFPASKRFVGISEKALLAVQLIPKQAHGQVKTIHLWFDNQYSIRKLVMEDHFDTVTELLFTEVKFDTLPADSVETANNLVQLNLPPETEIIRQ